MNQKTVMVSAALIAFAINSPLIGMEVAEETSNLLIPQMTAEQKMYQEIKQNRQESDKTGIKPKILSGPITESDIEFYFKKYAEEDNDDGFYYEGHSTPSKEHIDIVKKKIDTLNKILKESVFFALLATAAKNMHMRRILAPGAFTRCGDYLSQIQDPFVQELEPLMDEITKDQVVYLMGRLIRDIATYKTLTEQKTSLPAVRKMLFEEPETTAEKRLYQEFKENRKRTDESDIKKPEITKKDVEFYFGEGSTYVQENLEKMRGVKSLAPTQELPRSHKEHTGILKDKIVLLNKTLNKSVLFEFLVRVSTTENTYRQKIVADKEFIEWEDYHSQIQRPFVRWLDPKMDKILKDEVVSLVGCLIRDILMKLKK